jgi:hypothetical protein
MLGQEQQLAAVQLSHYVYKLLSIISQQMTSVHRFILFCSLFSYIATEKRTDNSSKNDTITVLTVTVVLMMVVVLMVVKMIMFP